MDQDRKSFFDEHAGKVLATLSAALVLAAGAWAVQMDRQSVEIAIMLSQIQRQLDRQSKLFGELGAVDRRVSRIEDTRFSSRDADKLRERCDVLRLRVGELEKRHRIKR